MCGKQITSVCVSLASKWCFKLEFSVHRNGIYSSDYDLHKLLYEN